MSAISFEPIGHIESCFRAKFGTPRQPQVAPEAKARIILNKDLQAKDCLEGLEDFSHLWICSLLHENKNKSYSPKVRPPRLNGKNVGVFASRSPHRPNPIGLSLVKIEKIEDNIIWVSGIDLIDGTPILDIKPYIPEYDSATDVKSGWTSAMSEKFEVEFHERAEKNLKALIHTNTFTNNYLEAKSLITSIIGNDPRPLPDKIREEQGHKRPIPYGFYLYDLNVLFEVNGKKIVVVDVEPAKNSYP